MSPRGCQGEFLGIIGPNGAGKTSLFNLFSGCYRPTAGSIELDGLDITHDRRTCVRRRGIGRTFQISSVFPLLTMLENVAARSGGELGGTLRLWRRATRVSGALERARAALVRVGLGASAQPAGGLLSHGDKRRLEIAMLLAADKPVLMLDEPMAGVAAERRAGARRAHPRRAQEEKKTVLMVEHHIDVVTGLAERIAVMHHGALLAVDTPAAVMANETVQ